MILPFSFGSSAAATKVGGDAGVESALTVADVHVPHETTCLQEGWLAPRVGLPVHVKSRRDTPERSLSMPISEDHSTIWDHWAAPSGAALPTTARLSLHSYALLVHHSLSPLRGRTALAFSRIPSMVAISAQKQVSQADSIYAGLLIPLLVSLQSMMPCPAAIGACYNARRGSTIRPRYTHCATGLTER